MKKFFAWAGMTALVIGLIAEPVAAQRGGGGGGGRGNAGGGGGGGAARAGGGGGGFSGGARAGGGFSGGGRVGGGGFSGGRAPSGGARIGGGGFSGGGARVGGGSISSGARIGGGSGVQVSPRVQSAAPRVQAGAGSQFRGNLGGTSPANRATGRITTGRPNIDAGTRVGGGATVDRGRTGADVNVRSRVGGADLGSGAGARGDLSDRVRGALDGRAGGNLDARVRGDGANVRGGARVDSGNRADRLGNFLDIDRAPNAGADVRGRAAADGRTRGDLNSRVRGGLDSAARAHLRASWADNVRLNQDINRNLANALQGSFGDRDGRDGRDGRGDFAGRGDGRRGDWNRWDGDGRYGNWARNTRGYWGRHGYPYFGAGWWGNYGFNRPYSYFNYWYGRPYGYWWGAPRWTAFNGWFGWGGWNGWNTPYYYSYGPSGYVVYQDDGVYIGGQYVGTPEVYAASAAQLAAVDPNQIPADQQGEWMPLGTFAFITSDSEAEEPSRFVQLAVDQNGLISGTMFNENREQAYSVEGRVDKETQRVAFTISNNRDIVFETGIYNLTQDETQLLAHFSPDDTRTFLLVRLEQPEQGAEELEAEARVAERPSR